MNARQKKKKLKKWALDNDLEEKLYCENCGEKLDIKRNKYALKWGTCNSYCYGVLVGEYC